MARTNFIIKHGLESETDALLESGYSTYQTIDILKENHREIKGIDGKSHMVVQRYKDIRDKMKLEEIYESGEDPSDIIDKEVREGIRKIVERLEKWSNIAEELYEEAKQDGTLLDRIKILKEIRDTISQERKSWESLKQYGTRQQINIGEMNKKKEQTFNIQLLSIAKDICPTCSKTILSRLSEFTEEDNVIIKKKKEEIKCQE